mgnify:CR=1 FL=1
MIAVDFAGEAELRDLYRELILDHSKQPRHFGKLDGATHTAEGINPLCGDKLRLYLRLGSDHTIRDASFEGSGCAISVASASLMTDTVIGLSVEAAQDYITALTARLTASSDRAAGLQPLDLSKLKALDGVREFPARVKCATLAWHALDSAIRRQPAPVSTE